MSTPKNNGTTTQGVQPVKGNEKNVKLEIVPPVSVNEKKPKTISYYLERFENIEKLVDMRRILEAHKERLELINATEEESKVFEVKNTYGLRIELHSSDRRSYDIPNPALVEDVKAFLLSRIDSRIQEINDKIIAASN